MQITNSRIIQNNSVGIELKSRNLDSSMASMNLFPMKFIDVTVMYQVYKMMCKMWSGAVCLFQYVFKVYGQMLYRLHLGYPVVGRP